MVKKAQNEWMSIYAEMNKTGFKDTIGAQPKKKKKFFCLAAAKENFKIKKIVFNFNTCHKRPQTLFIIFKPFAASSFNCQSIRLIKPYS